MPRIQWPLLKHRPMIQVFLTLAADGQKTVRNMLADTGAGNGQAPFELLLEEHDCVLCGGQPGQSVKLRGAYAGSYPRDSIRVEIPQLAFDANVHAVGVPNPPTGLDGIACFRFLNRFTYGNFGNQGEFGLEA